MRFLKCRYAFDHLGFLVLVAVFVSQVLILPWGHAAESIENKEVLAAINRFYDAFEAKSLEQLGKTVDPDLIVLEDTEMNLGWPNYRDTHIGKEMKEWKFFHAIDRKVVRIETYGKFAYAIMQFTIEMGLPKKTLKLAAAETLILVKNENGEWVVKHVHSSAAKIKGSAGS